MIVAIGFVLGLIWGGLLARRRGGARLDMVQYAASFGIAFALVGLFVTIFMNRAGL